LVIDLNLAFMPSCAHDAFWAYPLSAAGNTISGAVPVGELWPGAGNPVERPGDGAL
jgi:hypothetical protein